MSKLKAAAALACLVVTASFAGVTYQTIKTSVAVESTSQAVSQVVNTKETERVQVTTTEATEPEILQDPAEETEETGYASTTRKSTSASVRKTTRVTKKTTTETTTTTAAPEVEEAPAEEICYEAEVTEAPVYYEEPQEEETEAFAAETAPVMVMAPEDTDDDEPAETAAPVEEAPEETTTTQAPETTTTTTTTAKKSNAITVSQSEYYLLCNVVAHEYGSNWVSEYDKALVVEVVMNRVKSSRYPNTILGVITQPYQFSGSSSYAYLNGYSYQVTQSVKNAVDLYLSDPSQFNHGYTSFYGDGYRNYFS